MCTTKNESIRVRGAREHNLKNVNVDVPQNRLVVFTGVSGSGKSSLVFDTIYAASYSEYLDSLSSYARRSLPRLPRPDVDHLEELSPSVAIRQEPLGRNPRSTVGTVTEAWALLRLLYSRVGDPPLDAGAFSFNTPAGACSRCAGLGVELQPDPERLFDMDRSLADGAIRHRTWKVGSRYWNIIAASDFDVQRPLREFSPKELDRLLNSPPVRRNNDEPGYVQTFSFEGVVRRLLKRQSDTRGQEGREYDLSFFTSGICSECGGSRLNERARAVKLAGRSIVELAGMEVAVLRDLVARLRGPIASTIGPLLGKTLTNLIDSGVPYLSLSRSVATLSSGESQRVKLARQLGSALSHVIYVLDEPSLGLHPRDIGHLNAVLRRLADKPNSVLVVEHNREVIRAADWVIELGPGAGDRGGEVIAQGTPKQIAAAAVPTARLLRDEPMVRVPGRNRGSGRLVIRNARLHNLTGFTLSLPTGVLVVIAGVSGSGKSSLIEVLKKQHPGVLLLDQMPTGTSSRSIPATYVDAFTGMRQEFAVATRSDARQFAFNGDGACTVCGGLGFVEVDMHYLGDVTTVCDECQGRRYRPEVLVHIYRGQTIADVMGMTIQAAATFFAAADVRRRLGLLVDVGLGYLRVGQSLSTLSGGELQRIKIAEQLTTRGSIYVLDEPSRGLHIDDVAVLYKVLERLVGSGNTVIATEHNVDLMCAADWIVEVGPGGGSQGGRVVAEGTPEEIARLDTPTAPFLRECLARMRKASENTP